MVRHACESCATEPVGKNLNRQFAGLRHLSKIEDVLSSATNLDGTVGIDEE